MSTRERMMKRSSMGWSKKTKAMEGFAFTIKAQIAGKEDLPITSQWRTVVASPYESPKKYSSDAGQPEPSSYFLEASPNVQDAPRRSSLSSIKFKWSTNQELRGIFGDLKGWVTRKSKIEVSTSHLREFHTSELLLPVSKPVDVPTTAGTSAAAPSPVVTGTQRRRPQHPPLEIGLGERSETSWMELWKAAKAGIARDNAVLPTRQVALGTSLRKQITIRGSPLRQSHVIKSVSSDHDEFKGAVEFNDAMRTAVIKDAMFEIVHRFDLPHKHKQNQQRKRSLADQVTRHKFRQSVVGQYSKSTGAPASVRPRPRACAA